MKYVDDVKSLHNYASMPVPIESMIDETCNILILYELAYDMFKMCKNFKNLFLPSPMSKK